MQVLALMNAANNSCSPTIIDYTEFYNMALDHMDLMKVFTMLIAFHSDHIICDHVNIKVRKAANLLKSTKWKFAVFDAYFYIFSLHIFGCESRPISRNVCMFIHAQMQSIKT